MTLEPFEYMDYVIIKGIGQWELKKDAPEHVKKAFKEFMDSLEMVQVQGG